MALSDNLRGILYMNASMLAFTLNDTFMKAVSKTIPLYEAIALRGVLSTLGLICIALVTTRSLMTWPKPSDRKPLAIRTIAEVGSTVMFLGALMHMPLANLSAIMAFLPLAVTLGAALILGERVGWRRMVAILCGFVGVMTIIRPGAEAFDIWSVVGLGAVVFVVARDLATRQFSKDLPSVTAAVWAAAAVMGIGFLGASIQGWQALSLWEGAMILGAAVFLIGGYLLAIMVMRVGDIGVVAPFRYSSLLWAILLGWMLFGTVPDGMTLLGSAIVVASGIYMLLRERKLRIVRQAAA